MCPSDKRFLLLFTFLKKNKKKKIMVFFSSCLSVKYHHELLNYIDLSVMCIHVSTLCCIFGNHIVKCWDVVVNWSGFVRKNNYLCFLMHTVELKWKWIVSALLLHYAVEHISMAIDGTVAQRNLLVTAKKLLRSIPVACGAVTPVANTMNWSKSNARKPNFYIY